MLRLPAFCVLFMMSVSGYSQIHFSDVQRNECLPVTNQQITGTCWSFSATSYLESEIIRLQKEPVNLSEMFTVRNIYLEKALNYVLRQGKANFSEGSLAHDVLNSYAKYGTLPQEIYSGLAADDSIHNHSELAAVLKGYLDGVISTGKPSKHWMEGVNSILDVYLGKVPDNFTYKGKKYTPKSFAEEINLPIAAYLHLTSFSHHPFYSQFILEIPDNFSNQSFYNLPLNELLSTIDNALKLGFTVEWDGDVSEDSFSQIHGVAFLPFDKKMLPPYEKAPIEIAYSQELRQEWFLNYTTTDDHLMHITGSATDEAGNPYYIIKNSWGAVGPYDGYLYMSKAYIALKTISVTLHRDAIPEKIVERIQQ